MPGVALTLAAVAELFVAPACGGIDAVTPEGALLRDHLVAKVRHESGLNPLAIRVEDERRAIMDIATEADAVREAMRRLERGQTLGLGFGQITHKDNLARDFGVADWRDAVPLAFRPCDAVRAMVRHYAGNVEQAARVLDCASGAYWSGRVECGTGYARSIAAIRAALPGAVETPVSLAAPPPVPVRRAGTSVPPRTLFLAGGGTAQPPAQSREDTP